MMEIRKKLQSSEGVEKDYAELALISVVNTIINIKISESMEKYNKSEVLQQHFPGYSVKLGFGIQIGWAIEGTLGSMFKIDTTYLSPNVNITMKLEELTKTYKQDIVFTGEVFDYFAMK